MGRKLLIRLLLNRKNKFFDFVTIKGQNYLVDIHVHEPGDKFINRMEKALHRQGLND